MKFCDIKKQGQNEKGLWCIGTLVLENGIEINGIFATNLQKELDTTQVYQVKKFKISSYKDKIQYKIEF